MENKELNKIKDNTTSKVKEKEGRETVKHAVLVETINGKEIKRSYSKQKKTTEKEGQGVTWKRTLCRRILGERTRERERERERGGMGKKRVVQARSL